jgi:hypothetical protein
LSQTGQNQTRIKMKTTWLILGVLGMAILATAQTNEPVIQVKQYRVDHLTNEINLGVRSGPVLLRGTVEAVYKKHLKLLMDNPYNDNDPNNGKEIAVQNYPELEQLAVGQKLVFPAEKIGAIRATLPDGTPSPGYVLELWDYYVQLPPPQPTAEEIAAAKAKKEQAAKAYAEKVYEAQAKAVLLLQSEATNGEAFAQCSLGEHYLNGIGCETNRTFAVYWLTQAANQGDIEASNKLAKLNP